MSEAPSAPVEKTVEKVVKKPAAKPAKPNIKTHPWVQVRSNPKPVDVAGKPIVLIIGGAVCIVYVARLASAPGDVLRHPGQMVKIALGGSFCVIVLLMFAEVNGKLAEQFAWLILLFTIVQYGMPAFGLLTKIFKQPVSVTAKPGTGPAPVAGTPGAPYVQSDVNAFLHPFGSGASPVRPPAIPPMGGVVTGWTFDPQSGKYVQIG